MNYLSHLVLADVGEACPSTLAGAMAPDFASMAGVRLSHATISSEAVTRGVQSHLAVDKQFHSDPLFRDVCRTFGKDLANATGLRAPIAVGLIHVAIELYIDGLIPPDSLRRWPDAIEACRSANLVDLVPAHDRKHWLETVDRLRQSGPPDYSCVKVVSRRAVSVLNRRPRLRVASGIRTELQGLLEDATFCDRCATLAKKMGVI